MVGRRFPCDEEKKDIVIVGTGDNADAAFEYFVWDSPHNIKAFSAEREYIERDVKFGRPVVPFENLEDEYPPGECALFVAIGYMNLNQTRARLYREGKAKGYEFVSYISSEAFVWHNARIGENCLVLEDNTIQPYAKIGNNVILWSGNHIGHGVEIGDHVFVASHVVASGYSSVGDYSFVGVNVSIGHKVRIGKNCIVGANCLMNRDAKDGEVFVAQPAKPFRLDSEAFLKLMEI